VRGFLYVLSNPHMPGLLKIGHTVRTPAERAAELSNATGVPGDYRVERSWLLDDAEAFERRVHTALAAYRVPGSEHFRLPVADAIERIEAMLRAEPELRATHPAWRHHFARIVAVIALIAAYWGALRRLRRTIRHLQAVLRSK
jgi:hypothetical protein